MSMKLIPSSTRPCSDPALCYMWPPRSYSCGFCRREFKSAQALGGHMNVHRRDRARLKQQPQEVVDVGSKIQVQENSRKSYGSKREISEVCNKNNVLDIEHYNEKVKTDLSVGLASSEFDPQKKELIKGPALSCKRAKKDVPRCPMMLELLIGVAKINGHHEEVDLELRLGANPPNVN